MMLQNGKPHFSPARRQRVSLSTHLFPSVRRVPRAIWVAAGPQPSIVPQIDAAVAQWHPAVANVAIGSIDRHRSPPVATGRHRSPPVAIGRLSFRRPVPFRPSLDCSPVRVDSSAFDANVAHRHTDGGDAPRQKRLRKCGADKFETSVSGYGSD